MNRWLCSALVVTCALAACGTTTTAPSWFVRSYLGAPSANAFTSSGALEGAPAAIWAKADQMSVVAWGSSGCPKLPIALKTTGNALTLTLSSGTDPNGGSCTTDLAPTTTVIRVPNSIDQSLPVSVTFIDGGMRTTVVLPPRPSAG